MSQEALENGPFFGIFAQLIKRTSDELVMIISSSPKEHNMN